MKLRRTLLAFCTLMLAAGGLTAAPVDRADSPDIAVAHLLRLGVTDRSVAGQADITDHGQTLARIVTLSPAGYVVVAADDDLPPVIAYSLESDYPVDGPDVNPLRRLLLADLSTRLANTGTIEPATRAAWREAWSDLRSGTPTRALFDQWPPAGTTPTGGWLEDNWTQNAPFNNLCPLDLAGGGRRSVAGCPAVAMAMILDFHETIHGTTLGTSDRYWHNYGGNTYWVDDAAGQYDFADFLTLNGFLTTVTTHWHDGVALSDTDKAALVFACGVAARQVYGAGGSGTFGVDQAHDAYQRFGFATSRLVQADDPDLFTDLSAEMQGAQLAHLAVVDPGWTMGHNVVVDGYNTDQYFHLNFGWGGAYNGWYLLPEEIPYGLTVVEGVVMDILPTVTTVEAETPAAVAGIHLAARPNPFNPRTEIVFHAPIAGHARLTVHDLAGRRVSVLLDGAVRSGDQVIGWAPHELPSGVYLARLELGGVVANTRVVLAK